MLYNKASHRSLAPPFSCLTYRRVPTEGCNYVKTRNVLLTVFLNSRSNYKTVIRYLHLIIAYSSLYGPGKAILNLGLRSWLTNDWPGQYSKETRPKFNNCIKYNKWFLLHSREGICKRVVQFLENDLTHQNVKSSVFDPSWMLAIPLLHLLSGMVKEFDEENEQFDLHSWWGNLPLSKDNIIQVARRCKWKT